MRILAGVLAFLLAFCAIPAPIAGAKVETRIAEKRVTLYTGESCSGSAGWTEVDSDSTHVTISCYEDDDPPAPPDTDPAPNDDNPGQWTI